MNTEPKQQPVKEGVRYLQSSKGEVYRLSIHQKRHLQGELWNGFQWVLATCCVTEHQYITERGCKELTPQQAADIIGVENVFGERKEGDEKCTTSITKTALVPHAGQSEQSSSPAPEPTAKVPDAKGARIYSLCPACGNTTLVLNRGRLLCTWHECPDPTLIDKGPKIPDKEPQWLPISQCDLKPEEAFHILRKNLTVDTYPKGVSDPKQFANNSPAITHYLRATGCYQIPKPPVVVKKDDGFEKHYKTVDHVIALFPDAVDKELIKQMLNGAWLASRKALEKEGGGE